MAEDADLRPLRIISRSARTGMEICLIGAMEEEDDFQM